MTRQQFINKVKKFKHLKITKIGWGWIDIKSLRNGIEMRYWNFMWDNFGKK